MTDYEMICQESKNLSTEEQAQVLQYIQSIQNEKGGGKREAEKAEHCPRCGGNSVIRFGHKRGKQRFCCKDCGGVFMASSGTIMENSHYDETVWSALISDTLDGFVTIDKTAERLGLSHDAAFHMRHKVLMSLQAREEACPTQLGGISELDETYVLESLKGRKFPENASRKPRKHGEKANQRGISNEQVCIMTGVERNGGPAYAVTLNRARPSAEEIKTAFQDHIESGCVAFTDGLKGYRHLEDALDCVIESVNRQEQKNAGTANLNNVNSFHSYIQERYSHYRGVATQYINRYNILFSTVYRAKESLSNIADAILRNVSVRVFSCWDVRHTDLVTI